MPTSPELLEPIADSEPVRDTETLRLYNALQKELIGRYVKFKGVDTAADALEWIDKNSVAFAQCVKIKPEILGRYVTEPDDVVMEVENLLS